MLRTDPHQYCHWIVCKLSLMLASVKLYLYVRFCTYNNNYVVMVKLHVVRCWSGPGMAGNMQRMLALYGVHALHQSSRGTVWGACTAPEQSWHCMGCMHCDRAVAALHGEHARHQSSRGCMNCTRAFGRPHGTLNYWTVQSVVPGF